MMKTSHCALGAARLTAFPALAETIGSVYMPLDLEGCEMISPPEASEIGGVFRCEGFGGMDVRVTEGDLRMFVSDAAMQTAAQQMLPAFNSNGETLEWRLADGKPFPTILRRARRWW